MKLKKSLGIIITGIMAMSLVACSEPETDKVESGSGTPTEEQQDQAKEEEVQQEEIVLADDELVKIVVTEKKKDMFGAGYGITIENKSDKKIIVQARDISIDGTMQEPILSTEVMPGKKANDMMQFMEVTELENLKNTEGKLVVLGEDFMDIQSYDIKID